MKNQCTATSKQTGERCKRSPIPGGNVCKFHGGGAPQVIAKARERILELVPAAISAAEEQLLASEDPHVRSRAWRDLLDRAGLGAVKEVDVSGGIEVRVNGIDLEELR